MIKKFYRMMETYSQSKKLFYMQGCFAKFVFSVFLGTKCPVLFQELVFAKWYLKIAKICCI